MLWIAGGVIAASEGIVASFSIEVMPFIVTRGDLEKSEKSLIKRPVQL
jgi:hypothetical protein